MSLQIILERLFYPYGMQTWFIYNKDSPPPMEWVGLKSVSRLYPYQDRFSELFTEYIFSLIKRNAPKF